MSARRPRWRRALGVAALAVGSAAVTLVAIELGLRVVHLQVNDWGYNARKYERLMTYDEADGYTLQRPYAHGFVYGVDVRFNAIGMRDRDHEVAKPPGTRRVLVLGDSNVVGLGAAEDDIFVRRLEPLLNDGSRPPVTVIAGGVTGWNTVAERNWLRAVGLAYAPDLIVVVYVSNDNELELPWATRPPAPPLRRAWQWLADHSRLVELATYAYRKYHPLRLDADQMRALASMKQAQDRRRAQPHDFEPDDPGWIASRAALLDILGMARARGAGMIVVSLSFGGGHSAAVRERLNEFSRETGVRVIDTEPWFAGHELASLLNSSLHPNAEGHAILAAGIARALIEDEHLR